MADRPAPNDPERLLSQALRAQAAGAPTGPVHYPRQASVPDRSPPLPVGWLLLIALVLGLLAGAVAGLVTVL